MLENITRWTSAYKGLALGALLTSAVALPTAAQTIYGLSGTTTASTLVSFSATAPGTLLGTLPITGVTPGQTIVGMDFRPNTGQLFAMGYDGTTTGANSQLYTLDLTTGVATSVAPAIRLELGDPSARIGFDFNPTVDRIRVVSSTPVAAGNMTTRNNYRLNPNNGAIAATDTNLAYATTDPNTGNTPSVGAVAYTNSYIGSTATVLYDIDEAASRLLTQNPPNNGTLNTIGTLSTSTTGNSQSTDFDIYYNTTTGANTAYLSASIAGIATFSATLYTLSLPTAPTASVSTTSVGAIGDGLIDVRDIAVQITRPATLPALTGQLAYALAGTNLITFDTAQPSLIRTSAGITLPTGTPATQTLVGLDIRPSTNTLYALGYDASVASPTANAQLYLINSTTGAATAFGSAIRLELGSGSIGFDFNPVADRIRVVGANRNNYRLNPTNAAAVFGAMDAQVAYTTGTNTPSIGAVAYTNSFNGTTATALYNYDEVLNQLNTQNTAAGTATDGQLTAVGASGITVSTASATITPNVDLDIFSTAAGVNTAYMVANTGNTNNTAFYTVNLTTGAATLVGPIGNGIAARDITIAAQTGVVNSTRKTELATSLSLYPNPLAGAARVAFGLPRAAHVELTVTDALGRTVDTVDAGQRSAGQQSIEWNRKGQAAGIYFFRLSFDGQPAGTRQGVLTE
ncbi:DUF4394 domain-containing protein [Hymenobacter volaticus]|uniref:DUF4394 domain-containing protein n=1 Tax=Hymenobacter volaticus TaxID=2932254 RepID=A0ABY4G3J7_9BACT|nr:DUF4394 domain-containing protein [Hymenobacter volaticus]UOQ65224.1 DUF4394 domain-containing protein [Hymenobacter volaticus]